MEKIRTVKLAPYRKGMGPTFSLVMFDTYKLDNRGATLIAYKLTQHEKGKSLVIFEGSDFSSSPCHAIDSDDAVRGLLGFLTLRPGDTDPEYFEKYSPTQIVYCIQHAEALSCYVYDRFGED
jgi:hypothetical protein